MGKFLCGGLVGNFAILSQLTEEGRRATLLGTLEGTLDDEKGTHVQGAFFVPRILSISAISSAEKPRLAISSLSQEKVMRSSGLRMPAFFKSAIPVLITINVLQRVISMYVRSRFR